MLREISQTEKKQRLISLYVESKTNKQAKNQRHREQIGGCQRQHGAGGKACEIKKGNQKVQMFSYKINKSWGCNVQH